MHCLKKFCCQALNSHLSLTERTMVSLLSYRTRISTRHLCVLFAIAALSVSQSWAQATYPTKPITVIVPFPAGGSTDVAGRLLLNAMSKTLGQNIVVENVGGASGTVGMGRVTRANPDGYTLGVGTIGTHVIVPALSKKPPYDAIAQFEPIGLIGSAGMTLIARPNMPAKSLKEFVSYLQANKSKVNYGSAGIGSMAHYGCVMFLSSVGVDATHVPYRGTAPAMTDLMGGQIDFMCDQPTGTAQFVSSGKVKGIAILSNEKMSQLPGVPTAASQGYKDTNVRVWTAHFAPKGTPPDIVKRLNEAMMAATKDPQISAQAKAMGLDLPSDFTSSPGAVSALIVMGNRKDAPLLQARKEYLD
jgi:tripartite-type tricarboxylate transporter receptor subunit TctC